MVERMRRLRMSLASSSPGASGDTARPNYVGPSGNGLVGRMNAGESLRNQGRSVCRPPLSVSRRRSRGLRKTPQWGAERRAGTRYGPAIPFRRRDRSRREADQRPRRIPRLRISALRYPLMEGRRVRNRQFGTTVRRDAPRGNAPAWVNICMEKGMRMSKFAHLTLHRHARACRGHPRLGVKARRGWPGHRRAERRRPSDGYARP